MAAALGLSTYRWNNNLKSILLLAAFPFLLLLLLAILVYLAAWFMSRRFRRRHERYQFQQFGLDSVTGGHGAAGFHCRFRARYWPYVVGAAVIWLLTRLFLQRCADPPGDRRQAVPAPTPRSSTSCWKTYASPAASRCRGSTSSIPTP